MSHSEYIQLDPNLFQNSLRRPQRSHKNTPRGRNGKLAGKEGPQQKTMLALSTSRDAQASKRNRLGTRRLQSAQKLISDESADQIVQRGLEGTKKLIQQLQSSQKRLETGEGSHSQAVDQESRNQHERLHGSASNRRLVFDESIAVDGFVEQNRNPNQSAIVSGLQDLNQAAVLDGQQLPPADVHIQMPPRQRCAPGCKQQPPNAQQTAHTRATEQPSDAQQQMCKIQMLEDKISTISVFQDKMRPLISQIKIAEHQDSIISSQLNSKISQERITSADIKALYQSLARKDEQMHELISEAQTAVLPLNDAIYSQLSQQKTILERVVIDMNEQRDQLSQGVKMQRTNFEIMAKQRAMQMETTLEEKVAHEVNEYRADLDAKVRGVREGVQRVLEEKVKREKEIVESRISSLRQQMDDNKEKIGQKMRALKDRMQNLQSRLQDQQRQQQHFVDQDEKQNNAAPGHSSAHSTGQQTGRKKDQDSPSESMRKGNMPLQMTRQAQEIDDAQSQSIKDIVNEQLQQFMKAQFNQQFVQQMLSQAMSERSTPPRIKPCPSAGPQGPSQLVLPDQQQQDNSQPESSLKSAALNSSTEQHRSSQRGHDQSRTQVLELSNRHDEADQSITQSQEISRVHGSFQNKTLRSSPDIRSRNNSKNKVHQSQANIDLSMMNNSADGDTNFRSNINKYQRDGHKRYLPYGMKEAGNHHGREKSSTGSAQNSSDSQQMKNPQILQRQREQYCNNNTTLVNQSTFSKLSLPSHHSGDAHDPQVPTSATYDEMPLNVTSNHQEKKNIQITDQLKMDPFQVQNPLSTFCSEKQINLPNQQSEHRAQADLQSLHQRSERTVKLESLPPSQVRINYRHKMSNNDFSPMVNLDSVSVQSTTRHHRNKLSTARGNEPPGACPPTVAAVDDVLSATQSENLFGLGKTASSALNKTQKSLQLDINKIHTTHGVMYLKTEEELRPSTIEVYEKDPATTPAQPQPAASMATSVTGREDIDDDDDEVQSKKIHGNTPVQQAQRLMMARTNTANGNQIVLSTEFSNYANYRAKLEQYRLVKQSIQNVLSFSTHSQIQLSQQVESLSNCISTNQNGLNIAIGELTSLSEKYNASSNEKIKLSQAPEVTQMASKILNQFDSFKEYCGQENVAIVQCIDQRESESKEMIQQIQNQFTKFKEHARDFRKDIIEDQAKCTDNAKINPLKKISEKDLEMCTENQKEAILKDKQKIEELEQELQKLWNGLKTSSNSLREQSKQIEVTISQLQAYLVQQIDHGLQYFSDDVTTQDKGERITQYVPSPSNAASSRVGQTSNMLLKEFLTQNTREDNFMSNSKALFQMYNQSIIGGPESAKLRRNRRVEDESLTDLSISKDPPQGNSSIISKNVQPDTSKDGGTLNCPSKSQSKDNLLNVPSTSELVPDSQASLQNTKQIDLNGMNLNLQNFQQIKGHINSSQEQEQASEETPASPGTDSDLDAPTVDRDEEIKCSDVEYSHLFSHVTTPHIEVASNTRHSQRFFDMSSSSRQPAESGKLNQKINKDLIEIIDANCNIVPSINGDDQDVSSSQQQADDHRVCVSTIVEEECETAKEEQSISADVGRKAAKA